MEQLLKRPPRTSAEEIRQRLAEQIISGALAPGTALDESALANSFAVSRTPIREALRLLAASGLIDQKPHARAMVAHPDDDTLAGMFDVMRYLEALCAGLSSTIMTAAERRALDDLHQEMGRIVRGGDREAYTRANDRFHNAIYRGAHNPYLEEITLLTRQRVQPFRRAQFSSPGRLAKSHAEHGLIVEAILQGKKDEAERHMRSHIALVRDAFHAFAHGEAELRPI